MSSPSRNHYGVTVFVPAFNEATTLEGVVKDVLDAATVLDDIEVIIVNDGSRDETGVLATRLAHRDPRVRVIHHAINRGIAAGYRHALASATMPWFTFVPGDGEVAGTSISALFASLGAADIVIPYHANPEARPWHRRLLTRVSTALLNHVSGQRLRYYQGPCIYPTSLARSLPATSSGFFFLAEMLVYALRRGHSFVEVGLIHQERTGGKSQAVSVPNILRALGTVVRLWWHVPA